MEKRREVMATVDRTAGGADLAAEWGDLVRRFAPYVHGIAVCAYGLPESEAHDVFQQVFARTWGVLGNLDGDDAVRTWIGTLTCRLAQEARERLGGDLEPPAETLLSRLEDALTVREAIRRLPPTQREVAIRRWLHGDDEEAIAAAIGLPVEVVTSHVERARRRLRRELEAGTHSTC